MGTPCGHPAGRDCCRLCSSSRKADLMLLARGLPRPVRLRKDCWSAPDKSVQPYVVSAFLGVFLSQEQERISLMLNLFKSIYPRMLLTWKLIPPRWTGPALLPFPGRGHKGLTSESIFPHRSTSPAHFRDSKSKASFRVKKEKKRSNQFPNPQLLVFIAGEEQQRWLYHHHQQWAAQPGVHGKPPVPSSSTPAIGNAAPEAAHGTCKVR